MSVCSPRYSGCGEAAGCVPPLALTPVHDEDNSTVTELRDEYNIEQSLSYYKCLYEVLLANTIIIELSSTHISPDY